MVTIGIRTTVRRVGKPIEDVIGVMKSKTKLPKIYTLDHITKELLKELRIFIDRNRNRSKEKHTEEEGPKGGERLTATNNLINVLAEGIYIKQTNKNKYELRIGEYRFLNKYAPYWYVLNYGKTKSGKRYKPPKTMGYFGTGQAPTKRYGQAFHYTKNWKNAVKGNKNAWGMVPNKYVTPMYYLNYLNQQFKRKITEFLAKVEPMKV